MVHKQLEQIIPNIVVCLKMQKKNIRYQSQHCQKPKVRSQPAKQSHRRQQTLNPPNLSPTSGHRAKPRVQEHNRSQHRSCQHRCTHRNILKTTATGTHGGKAQEGQGHQKQRARRVAANKLAESQRRDPKSRQAVFKEFQPSDICGGSTTAPDTAPGSGSSNFDTGTFSNGIPNQAHKTLANSE